MSFLGMVFAFTASAKDLGTLGKMYQIGEQDFLEYIQNKLQIMKASGKLAALQKSMKKRAVKTIMHPESVKGLKTATENKTYYYDTSITVSRDIRDFQGRLIQAKGTHINPLDSVSMNSILVFVKGDDPAQMAWVLRLKKSSKLRVKIVLVSGPVIDLMRRYKTRLFFDQKGKLTQRFGITQVPAKVYQEGKRLRIDEVVVLPSTTTQRVSLNGVEK